MERAMSVNVSRSRVSGADETFSLLAVLYYLCHLSSSLEREYLKTLQEQSN